MHPLVVEYSREPIWLSSVSLTSMTVLKQSQLHSFCHDPIPHSLGTHRETPDNITRKQEWYGRGTGLKVGRVPYSA